MSYFLAFSGQLSFDQLVGQTPAQFGISDDLLAELD